MLKKLIFILKCSRLYTLPMTFFSWLIIFCYSLKNNGNFLYGILALLGILVCHLATNLLDDYIDFNYLKKNIINNLMTLPNTQRGKCAYLLNKSLSRKDVLVIILCYLFIALIIGLFFLSLRGVNVLYLMIVAAVVILGYSFLSYIRLSELAVAFTYGPLLFCGVYYVMVGHFSWNSIWISIPSMLFTVNLIFTDTLMDYDIDKKEGKKTFVGLFSKPTNIFIQIFLLHFAYFSVILLEVFHIVSLKAFLVLLTIPLEIDLVNSTILYVKDKTKLPQKRWYHFPFEEWKDVLANRSAAFMFRMYQARNLMIYVSILFSIGIL